MESATQWYVLCVRGGADDQVATILEQMGFRVYSPTGQKIMLHHRNKSKVHKPFRLFPGYLFLAGTGPEDVTATMQFPGVYGFLGQDGSPRSLPVDCVEELQQHEQSGDFDIDHRRRVGDRVPIQLFDQELVAEIQSVTARGKVEAVVKYMDRMIKLTDEQVTQLAV